MPSLIRKWKLKALFYKTWYFKINYDLYAIRWNIHGWRYAQNFKTQKPLSTAGTVCRGTCIAVECWDFSFLCLCFPSPLSLSFSLCFFFFFSFFSFFSFLCFSWKRILKKLILPKLMIKIDNQIMCHKWRPENYRLLTIILPQALFYWANMTQQEIMITANGDQKICQYPVKLNLHPSW